MVTHQVKFAIGVAGAEVKTYVVILPHEDEDHEWTDDGVTCYGGAQCMAVAAVSELRCRKAAIVAMEYLDHRGRVMPIGICGGHFAVHRDGHELRVVD